MHYEILDSVSALILVYMRFKYWCAHGERNNTNPQMADAFLCSFFTHFTTGHVLFNDALNTFNLRLYGVRHAYGKGPQKKREKKPAAVTWLLFPISSKGYFICIIPQTG